MRPAKCRVPPLIAGLAVLVGAAAAPRVAAAQADGSIRGAVVATGDQRPVSDARVQVLGTSLSAVTGQNGEYSITGVPAGTHQVRVRMIGFAEATQAVTVTAGEAATADFSLEQRVLALNAVTVTALGIERQRRETPYALSEVKSPQLVDASPMSLQSALYGEVPGLKIQQNSSGPTGGTNLTIRGNKSITSTVTRPLIVVDGIPIRDGHSGYSELGWVYDRDLGTGINDLNPNDIESVNVLKGAGASALYGAQAANGVMLITTKRGTRSGLEFSSSSMFDRVAFLPEFQNVFGAGRPDLLSSPNNGEFPVDSAGTPLLITTSRSWGPPMRGQMVRWWDGQMRPFTPQPDNFRDLYQPGRTLENSAAYSSVTDRSRYRIGYTRSDWTGTFPGSRQKRNTVSVAGDVQLSHRLRANVAFNYYDRILTNPPPRVYIAFSFPRSVKADVLKQAYRTPDGYVATLQRFPRLHDNSERRMMQEILWEGLEDRFESAQDRLLGSLRLNYALAGWLDLRLQGSTDYTDNSIEDKNRATQPASAGPSGGYERRRQQDRVRYGEVLLTAQRQLTPAVGLSALVGAATTRTSVDSTAVWTSGGLVAENWFSINNSRDTPGRYAGRGEERTDGVFGSATVSYRDYLYLTATGRNDWTSTLPPNRNSYFYPSVGASFVFSDAFRLPSQISSGKLRANHARVGRGAQRYQANHVYSYGTFEGGVTVNSFSTVVPPLDLKPEQKSETELGLEMSFLDERVGFDATFFHQRNVDQIIDLAIPYSSGATNITTNTSLMTNTGLELYLLGTPIRTPDVEWSMRVNVSRNRNKLERLAAGVQSIVLQNFEDNLYVEARAGRPFGEIYGYDFRRGPDGQRIVDQDGFYAKSTTLSLLGNINPNWLGGVSSTLHYKSFDLSLLLDFRIGGQHAAMSNYYGLTTGRLKETLFGRDEAHGGLPYYIDAGGEYVRLPGHDATAPGGATVYHDGIILKGVKETFDASGNVTGYVTNDQLVPVWLYHEVNFNWKTQGIYSQVVYDNNYVKLRELTLSFRLPGSWTRYLPTSNLRFSLVGRNLFYLHKTLPHIDPESAISTLDVRQGLNDYIGYHPTNRSLGFKISGSF